MLMCICCDVECGWIQLWVGCVTSVQRSVSSVWCVLSVGRAFTLAASQYQSGTSVHAVVGGVGIRGEQGLAFARCTKPYCPAWCPHQHHHTSAHSHSVTPAELCPPNTHTHTQTPSVLAAPLPAYQKYARQNNGCFIHTKPGMCLNVAGWVSLFSLSTLCVPCFPWEREEQTHFRRRGKVWQWEPKCEKKIFSGWKRVKILALWCSTLWNTKDSITEKSNPILSNLLFSQVLLTC